MQVDRHFNGIESLDHPVLAAKDLDSVRVSYERLGFTIPPRGSHVEWGTGNLCIMFPDDYLQIRGIVDATRFTMNLDKHLDRYGEGLMGVAFRTDDVHASYTDMIEHGMHVSEPRTLTRNFEHPEGWTQPQFELCVPEADDIAGLMHVVVLQHITPALIRRPEFLTHANGCVGVSDMSGIIQSVAEIADKLALLLGDDAVSVSHDGVRLELPTGQRIYLLRPHAYRTRFGSSASAPGFELRNLRAITLRVDELTRTGDLLAGNGLEFDSVDDCTIRIGPDHACGVILDFTEEIPG
jgi:hypothetical protein